MLVAIVFLYCLQEETLLYTYIYIYKSTGAEEYTDYFSAEG